MARYTAPNYFRLNGTAYNNLGDLSSAFTWTFVDEPTRNNLGQIENLNESDRFPTFRIWVNWKFLSYETFLQFNKDASLPEFTVEAFDYDNNEWRVARMYLQKEEQKKMFQAGNRLRTQRVGEGLYNDGVEIKGIFDFSIQLVGTNIPIDRFERVITYNANGGSGIISNQVGTQGTVVQLSNGDGLIYPQKKLQSWNTKADGSGTSYALGEPYYFMDMNFNLYAIWVNITDWVMSLNYSGLNGAEIGSNPKEINVRQGQTFNGLPTTLTRQDYNFDGWYDLQYDYVENDNAQFQQWISEGKITKYINNSTKYPTNTNTTIFVKWLPINYTINFNSNGGTAIQSITQGFNTYIEPFLPPTRQNFKFVAWYTDVALKNIANIKRMTAPKSGTAQTFYARWANE